jgi:hypothetical protein
VTAGLLILALIWALGLIFTRPSREMMGGWSLAFLGFNLPLE